MDNPEVLILDKYDWLLPERSYGVVNSRGPGYGGVDGIIYNDGIGYGYGFGDGYCNYEENGSGI